MSNVLALLMDQQCHGRANNANVCTYLLLQATHFIKQANARKHQKKKRSCNIEWFRASGRRGEEADRRRTRVNLHGGGDGNGPLNGTRFRKLKFWQVYLSCRGSPAYPDRYTSWYMGWVRWEAVCVKIDREFYVRQWRSDFFTWNFSARFRLNEKQNQEHILEKRSFGRKKIY